MWETCVDNHVENVEIIGFSTVIHGFSWPLCMWKTLWTKWITFRLSTDWHSLCHRCVSSYSRGKRAFRLAFVGFSGKSDGGRTRHAPTIFVKNSQSPPPFPLFQPMYQFPALGNNDHVSDQQEENPCREKWRSAV